MLILLGVVLTVVFFLVVSRWIHQPIENQKSDFQDDHSLPHPSELELKETGVVRKYPFLQMNSENVVVFYNGLLMSSGIGTLLAEYQTINDPLYLALVESCNEYFFFEFNNHTEKDSVTLIKNKNEGILFFNSRKDALLKIQL